MDKITQISPDKLWWFSKGLYDAKNSVYNPPTGEYLQKLWYDDAWKIEVNYG